MALIIIDMQCSFKAACHDPTIKAVRREILLARCNVEPIIFLEYSTGTFTHPTLIDLLRTPRLYPDFEVWRKSRWSGADVVVDRCRRRGWPMNRFRLCGVETLACVAETAEELTEITPRSRIEVVRDACNDKVEDQWGTFPTHPNIQVVG